VGKLTLATGEKANSCSIEKIKILKKYPNQSINQCTGRTGNLLSLAEVDDPVGPSFLGFTINIWTEELQRGHSTVPGKLFCFRIWLHQRNLEIYEAYDSAYRASTTNHLP
jgi:hypothetical protein